MKKLFPVVAFLSLMVTACKSKKKEDTNSDNTTTHITTMTTSENTATGDVPKFGDAEIQKFAGDYTAFMTSIIEAYKAKDATKIKDLSGKISDWSSRSMKLGQKLVSNSDEYEKFSDYVAKLSKQITDAMTMK